MEEAVEAEDAASESRRGGKKRKALELRYNWQEVANEAHKLFDSKSKGIAKKELEAEADTLLSCAEEEILAVVKRCKLQATQELASIREKPFMNLVEKYQAVVKAMDDLAGAIQREKNAQAA